MLPLEEKSGTTGLAIRITPHHSNSAGVSSTQWMHVFETVSKQLFSCYFYINLFFVFFTLSFT